MSNHSFSSIAMRNQFIATSLITAGIARIKFREIFPNERGHIDILNRTKLVQLCFTKGFMYLPIHLN